MVYTPTAIEPQTPPQEASAVGTPRTGGVAIGTVGVVGLGYVGLPTGIALATAGLEVIGIDVSERRLADIREGSADLLADDQERLAELLAAQQLTVSCAADALADADAVLV